MLATGEKQGAIGASVMRKAFGRIAPLMPVANLFASTDRINASFAATRMNADLGFSTTACGMVNAALMWVHGIFEEDRSTTGGRI